MTVARHHYAPTELQRAEVKAAAELMRQRLAQRRREREAFDKFRRVFPEQMARECAHVEAYGRLP
jgi:hypothetical protein